MKTQLKLASQNQPASYASSVSVVFVSESMAQIDGAYMMPVANFTTTDGQCFDAKGNFLGVEIRPGFTAAVAKQRQMTPEVRPYSPTSLTLTLTLTLTQIRTQTLARYPHSRPDLLTLNPGRALKS